MAKLLLSIFIFISVNLLSQEGNLLNSEEKAYLFHVVKKSPILNNEIGRYFEYSGEEIKYSNGKLNYDSVELIIINQPELLFVRSSEIAKAPKGILAEASNKLALYELNLLLLSERSNDLEKDNLEAEWKKFNAMFVAHLPPSALRTKNGISEPNPKLLKMLNPSLNFDDKDAMLASYNFLSIEEKLQVLMAMNKAVNEYSEERCIQIFKALGGKADVFQNALIAAGDGSSTAGMMEEREKDERGRWNKGLPKAVGLFPYDAIIESKEVKKKTIQKIEPMRFITRDFETVGQNKATNIHLDVWGYNQEKQTTVVIEKNGKSYPLFGSSENRFLSPDSSFTGKMTFYALIHAVEGEIDQLNEMIYGRRGFDYWIEYWDKKRFQKLEDIDHTEMALNDLRSGTTYTHKKKRSKAGGKGSFNKTYSEKTKRGKKQGALIMHYEILASIKKKIAELKQDKADAIDLLAIKKRKLDMYMLQIGRYWMPFEEKDGLYIYEDSTQFDMMTQEFTFPASREKQSFEIRLLAIPYSVKSKEADEVMMHINIADAKTKYDATIQLELEDLFESDKYVLKEKLFSKKDSVALVEFFEAVQNKKMDLNIIARGQGIGMIDGAKISKNYNAEELSTYPDEAARNDSTFKMLRRSELYVTTNRKIDIEINSYTDPVKSNLSVTNEDVLELINTNKISKNDALSAYRSAFLLEKFRNEINLLAGEYLTRSEAKVVIDRLNKKIAKTKVNIGRYSFKAIELR